MSNYIHSTAIVSPMAKLGDGNYIGPYCVIGSSVAIGNHNRFEAYVSIGLPAEKIGYMNYEGSVVIGDSNIFREFVTVNGGTLRATCVNNYCILLKSSHVGHDSILEDKVTLSCGVKIGGESYIMTGANFGLNAVCHQRSKIGGYAMIGMGAVVTRKSKILPLKKYVGTPVRYIGDNYPAINRHNLTPEQQKEITNRFYELP